MACALISAIHYYSLAELALAMLRLGDQGTQLEPCHRYEQNKRFSSPCRTSQIRWFMAPDSSAASKRAFLSGPPLTEIGHSAFNLTHVRKTKIDCADFSGLAQGDGENEDEADEGPVPNYPRATQRCYSSSSVTGR